MSTTTTAGVLDVRNPADDRLVATVDDRETVIASLPTSATLRSRGPAATRHIASGTESWFTPTSSPTCCKPKRRPYPDRI